jgi:mono/diheme cytochrome c family protein
MLAVALVLALVAGVAGRGQSPPAKPAAPAARPVAPAATPVEAPRPAPPARPASSAAQPAAKRAAAAVPAHTFDSLVKPFIEENCASCHGTRRQKGGLNLAKYDSLQALTADADRWELVVQKLRDGDMPPEEEEPRPTKAQVAELTGFVEREIAKADAAAPPDPGRVTARRLNRTEYNHTVRDLLGLDLRPADEFPHDDSGYGFDNIGDVLSTSPLLLEKQMAAAERIARTAVFGVGTLKPSLVKLPMLNGRVVESKDVPASYDASGLTLPNAAHATYRVPYTGEYVIRLITSGRRPQGSEAMHFALWLDGKQIAEQVLDPSLGAGFDPGEQELSGRRVEFRIKLTAGEHWIAGTPLNLFEGLPPRFGGPKPSTLPPPPKPEFRPRPGMTPEQVEFARKRFEARLTERMVLNTPRVGGIEVIGPYGIDAAPSAESRARIYTCKHPAGGPAVHGAACRRPIVASLANRAYRRPVTRDEVEQLVQLATRVEGETGSFEEGLASAIQAILVSPDFLFRIERGEPKLFTARGVPVGIRLTQHELATRLAYFLWATMPDAALRTAADRGTLRQPAVLAAQVKRMLADPKSATLGEHFAGQWLQVRALESAAPDREKFPDFDHYLRTSMRRETELFVAAVVREDRSILDFLDGRFTYLNERLARHYGIDGVQGTDFRRVALPADGVRGGVITQASVLTVSSYATRTSPVLRGRWILDNILAAPPPEPPPDIPNLDDKGVGTATTVRQQLEQHRQDPSCASCHKRLDPLGFGLENFDAIGAWRTKEGTMPIDASGTLPDGRSFTGPKELRVILAAEKDAFTRAISGKLMTYALGRGLERSDRRPLKGISQQVTAANYRFSSLVLAIVKSDAFQMRRADAKAPAEPAAAPTDTRTAGSHPPAGSAGTTPGSADTTPQRTPKRAATEEPGR